MMFALCILLTRIFAFLFNILNYLFVCVCCFHCGCGCVHVCTWVFVVLACAVWIGFLEFAILWFGMNVGI